MFPILPGNSASTGYNLTRSLRTRASASATLNRTPASATNRQIFTWSGGVKRGGLTADNGLFSAGTAGSGNQETSFLFAPDALRLTDGLQAVSSNWNLTTTAVYRDPSAWYYIVVAVNTTLATATDRVKLYVNGVQITSFSSATYPTLNFNTAVNNTVAHSFGSRITSAYLDGYLAEVNFIDGQALTPSSFGSTNATTGVWQPARYTGSYGTNGFYLPFDSQTTASYAANFNGQWLNGNLASTIGTGDFTVEGWVYQNTITNYQTWVSIERGAGGFNIGTDAAGSLTFYSSSTPQISVSGLVQTGAWKHFAFVRSGTTLTAYLNGVSRGAATVSTNFSATAFYIGSLNNAPAEILNASLSNVRITGTAVYTSNFTPSTSPLTAISGTKLLTLQSSTIVDNSGNSISLTNNNSVLTVISNPFLGLNIASDQSGNGNNWTPNNISLTAGVTYDSMTDVPTLTSATASNFAVANPLQLGSYVTLSNSNLTVTGNTSANSALALGSIGNLTSGKWYWEYTQGTAVSETCGICTQNMAGVSLINGENIGSYGIGARQTGIVYGGTVGTITSWTTGDVIGLSVDCDNGAIYWSKNGTVLNGGVPTSGAGKTGAVGVWTPSSSKIITPAFGAYNGGFISINFGQRPFSYTPPTGFLSLSTFNLPDSTIVKGSDNMNIALAAGASIKATTEALFSGQFLEWIKDRANVNNHQLLNGVTGLSAVLQSNTTGAETTYSAPSGNSVGFAWKAGSSSSSNTSGSITSTVSVNASAGFSVVTYTGTGANATVGHGLGVAPAMIIVKVRSAGANWYVYHASMAGGANSVMYLDAINGNTASPTVWNNTAPTSSVFSLGNTGAVNGSGSAFVAYCWTPIAGYSAFGSYTGNGSADGPFNYTGFKTKFVLIKSASISGDWYLYDSSRDPYNATQQGLLPNSSGAEPTYTGWGDLLSNGFKIRRTDAAWNQSSSTYIYMAFAENPFKNSLGR